MRMSWMVRARFYSIRPLRLFVLNLSSGLQFCVYCLCFVWHAMRPTYTHAGHLNELIRWAILCCLNWLAEANATSRYLRLLAYMATNEPRFSLSVRMNFELWFFHQTDAACREKKDVADEKYCHEWRDSSGFKRERVEMGAENGGNGLRAKGNNFNLLTTVTFIWSHRINHN